MCFTKEDKKTIEDQYIELLQSPLCKQVNAAVLYSEILRYHDKPENWDKLINWPMVNQAIIDKWSENGLIKVKTMAWHLAEGEHLKLI